jgi:hypothetical protein
VSSLTRFSVFPSWLKRDYTGVGIQVTNDQEKVINMSHGFGSVSRRHSLNKPIIAAVNGGAFGGGVEIVLSCDIVIAEKDAKFVLPEVKHGVLAAAGGIKYPPLRLLSLILPLWQVSQGYFVSQATSLLQRCSCSVEM